MSRTYSDCWACYALSDADLAPMECQHCDRKPVKAPQTGARLTKTTVPTYSITGLTEAHLDTLSEALSVLEDEGYDSTLLPEFTELQAMLYQTHRE